VGDQDREERRRRVQDRGQSARDPRLPPDDQAERDDVVQDTHRRERAPLRASERHPPPARTDRLRRFLVEIREGWALVAGDERLRALVGGGALIGFFNAALEAVFVLYIARQLGVGPA
jgi:hypothetical protein